jgi:hypothetical protein
MGVSLHITLLRDGNSPQHLAMVAAKRALDAANLDYPPELNKYFDGSSDEDAPLEIEYKAQEFNSDYYSGYEIDLATLPEGVTKIRALLG